LPPGFQELLNYGEERLKEISEDIKRYERLVSSKMKKSFILD